MFIENKYTKIYYSIINHANIEPRSGYVEKHHIIPKSLGGSNRKENLVVLTAREHFVCHLLLTKMVSACHRRSMAWALHRMTFSQSENNIRPFTSAQFEQARIRFSKTITGTKQKEETKKKIGIGNSGPCSERKLAALKKLHEANRNKKRTAESIEKQKASMTESEKVKAHLAKLVALHTGSKHSEETKQRRSASLRKHFNPDI